MEIIKLLALLIGSAILFTCCSARQEPNLFYQEKPFRTHIIWKSNDTSFGAILTSLQKKDSSTTPSKQLTLEFTCPESLAGIRVCKDNESTTVTLGELKISSQEAERWLSVSALFEIEATVKESSSIMIDNQSTNLIRAVSDDGKEYTLHLFSASGLPRRISGEVNGAICTVDVISFEFIPDNT